MLGDRSYMRQDWGRRLQSPATVILMAAVTAAFALQQINAVYFRFDALTYLALSTDGLRHGRVWQLLSFQFLHGGLWHLVFNLIGLWFFGKFIEARLGSAHMLKVYFLSGLGGGLLQALVGVLLPRYFGYVPVVGASAGVLGLFAAAALLEPDMEILLFFVVPVRARLLLWVSAGIALFFTVVPADRGMAHAAHLGGILAGAAYLRWGMNLGLRRWRWPSAPRRSRAAHLELVGVPQSQKALRQRPTLTRDLEVTPAEFISQEVDPILDKISAHGIQSLTPRERKILESAREKMDRR